MMVGRYVMPHRSDGVALVAGVYVAFAFLTAAVLLVVPVLVRRVCRPARGDERVAGPIPVRRGLSVLLQEPAARDISRTAAANPRVTWSKSFPARGPLRLHQQARVPGRISLNPDSRTLSSVGGTADRTSHSMRG